jgi:hypothetical protein
MTALDPLSLFAFTDKSHLKERENWLRFLEMLLPVVMQHDAALISDCLEEAEVDSLDEILAHQERNNEPASFLRSVSAQLSHFLGLSTEFGLACFLKCSPHTRVHAQSSKELRRTEEQRLAVWFRKFAKLQEDGDFAELVSQWKEKFDLLLDSENELESFVSENKETKSPLDGESAEEKRVGSSPEDVFKKAV